MATVDQTYLDTYIQDGQKEVLSLKNFYDTILTADIDDVTKIIRIPMGDFFIKYRSQLDAIVQYYSVSDRFFYQPKSVSLELYGTTEMWLSLLRVNNMRNITEFHQPIIKIYNPTDVKELINILFKREGRVT
jgi:hypothetical protein